MTSRVKLPRILAEGVHWLGDCFVEFEGEWLHMYHSVFLINGERASLIVDTGPPQDWGVINQQLDALMEKGLAPVRYLFPTHSEVPHCSNLPRLLDKYPESVVLADWRDYHLFFPDYIDRLRETRPGDSIDLGRREFVVLPSVVKDLVTTLWGYDTGAQVLFPADGFAYVHHHSAGECGKTAEELPELPIPEFMAVFQHSALYWTRFTTMNRYVEELRALLNKYPCKVIAPGHGSPIMDPAKTMPRIEAGFLQSSR